MHTNLRVLASFHSSGLFQKVFQDVNGPIRYPQAILETHIKNKTSSFYHPVNLIFFKSFVHVLSGPELSNNSEKDLISNNSIMNKSFRFSV